jgi:hypothetical protein
MCVRLYVHTRGMHRAPGVGSSALVLGVDSRVWLSGSATGLASYGSCKLVLSVSLEVGCEVVAPRVDSESWLWSYLQVG